MVQGPSSYPHRGSVTSLYSEDSLQSHPSSAFQDDLNATFLPRHASSGTPSQFTDHTLPHEGTSLAAPEALRKKRRTGKRKRIDNPEDPKAAERLRKQRQSDDENIEYLYKLLVPSSEGEVPKKERLSLSTS